MPQEIWDSAFSLPGWLISSTTGRVALAVTVLVQIIALGVVPGNRRPSSGMAWLVVILFLPIVGLIIFFFLGSTRIGQRRHRRQRNAVNTVAASISDVTPLHSLVALSPHIASVVELNEQLSSFPGLANNDIIIETDYASAINRMIDAVTSAKHYVSVEFYITAWDDVTEPLFIAMDAAAKRGVEVRLLFDHIGSLTIPGYHRMVRKLRRTDIKWHAMLPIDLGRFRFRRLDLRNHRKLLVVDGRVGFTGSINLTEPSYNKRKLRRQGRHWVETVAEVYGPVVASLETVFASDWYVETAEVLPVEWRSSDAPDVPGVVRDVACQVVPSGPGYESENNLRLFNTLIYSATERLSMTSPYFVPDESLLYAVTTAAQRGVEVELFVSEKADQFMVGHAQASYYRALLEAGVRIYQYPAPAVLHAKHMSVDGEVAVIGSSNMDMRSFNLNYEISMMMLGPQVVAEIERVEDAYRRLSTELTLERWNQRSVINRYVDNVMRLTSSLQ